MEKTYSSWMTWENPSKQREYLQETQLLDQDGTLLTSGWAKKNVFKYDRDRVKHVMRRKEWDFYQISDGNLMLQISFANISLGGYASAVLVDLKQGKTLFSDMAPFVGGKDRYILPAKGDVPNFVSFRVGKAILPQARVRSRLHRLNEMILRDVEQKMAENTERPIRNTTAYLMSLIFNAISESESDLLVDPYLNRLRASP